MSRKFNSISERPWLKDNHQARSNRALELGKKAIDLLVKVGRPVTQSSIVEESKGLDDKGKGIHENTIYSNQELYEYYKQHSITYQQRQNSNKNKTTESSNIKEDIDYRKLLHERDPKNLEKNYMKLSKKELVRRLIRSEEYIIENNKNWAANQFEKFK